MNLVYAAAIAVLMGFGLYLLLSRQVLRIVFGIMLLSTSVNLIIFLAGRIGESAPPVIQSGEAALPAATANALPQALVLTAIVIGFSLVAFISALVLKSYRVGGSLRTQDFTQAEALGSPYEPLAEPAPASSAVDAGGRE